MSSSAIQKGPDREPTQTANLLWGLPRPALIVATLGGIVLGLAYSLSPVTVWFLLITPVFFRWAGRGLSGREGLWVSGVLGMALSLRLLALAAFFLLSDRFNQQGFATLLGDEQVIKRLSLVARNVALGLPVSPGDIYSMNEGYAQSGLIYAAAFLQILVGPAPYGLHLLNLVAFLVGAVVMHRLVRSAYGPLPAICGLVIVVFMPSLFVWSISALKEATYFLLTAVSISSVVCMVRSTGVRMRMAAACLALLAIAGTGTLRIIGVLMTGGGLSLGLVARLATLRAWVCLLAVLGLSIGGWYAAGLPQVQERVEGTLLRAAGVHLGHVETSGHSYRLLDPHFYTWFRYRTDDLHLQPDEAARFVTRAAISFVIVPVPWKATSRSMVAFLPQQVFWYVLVVLACVGTGAGLRRDPLLTWLLMGIIVCGSAAIALHSGNVGTLVRMRDMVVTMTVWLSALGACTVVESVVTRRCFRQRSIDP